MKTIVVLAAVLAAALATPADTYNAEYDNFDADEFVQNTRLLINYGKCFLETGPCTPEGAYFKKVIPEALLTQCDKCTPNQRQIIRIVSKGYQEKVPELWAEIIKKVDPSGEFKEEFEKFLNATD